MGSLVLGGVILVAAFFVFTAAAGLQRGPEPRPAARMIKAAGVVLTAIGAFFLLSSSIVVIDAGKVGVRHAFGEVDPRPLMPGVRLVTPWLNSGRFSPR